MSREEPLLQPEEMRRIRRGRNRTYTGIVSPASAAGAAAAGCNSSPRATAARRRMRTAVLGVTTAAAAVHRKRARTGAGGSSSSSDMLPTKHAPPCYDAMEGELGRQDYGTGRYSLQQGAGGGGADIPPLPLHLPRGRSARQATAAAAAHVEDAFFGEEDDEFKRPWLQKLFARLTMPRRCVMLLYVGFAFVERPSWCYRDHRSNGCTSAPLPDGAAAGGDGSDGAAISATTMMPLSQLPVLHESVTEGLEVCCLLWFMANLLMKRLFKGRATFWRNRANLVKMLLLLTALLDVTSFWVRRDGLIIGPLRLAPLIRPIIVITNERRLRETTMSVAGLLWAVRYVLFLIIFFVIWFGTLLYVLFDQFCAGGTRSPDCDESAYFGTLSLSYLSVFIMLTTANYPDVMMAAYSYSRWFALPFIAFLLFGLFFLLNVVLANIYSAYTRQLKRRAVDFNTAREKSLDIAYDVLLQEQRPAAAAAAAASSLLAAVSLKAASPPPAGIPTATVNALLVELGDYGTTVAPASPSGSGTQGLSKGGWLDVEAAVASLDVDGDGEEEARVPHHTMIDINLCDRGSSWLAHCALRTGAPPHSPALLMPPPALMPTYLSCPPPPPRARVTGRPSSVPVCCERGWWW
jgi:hypothetical protein